MYRESILGMALAATLAELEPRLTARQAEEVWRIFDEVMTASLATAPLMSHIAVSVPPASSLLGEVAPGVEVGRTLTHVPALATNAATPAAAPEREGVGEVTVPADSERPQGMPSFSPPPPPQPFDDSHLAFPVSRLCDGVWTVLLKNPTVVVRDELGRSEKIQLDYLKMVLKDLRPASGGASTPRIKWKRARKS